ncbi:ABC transporter substrate-binding protein [Anaerococcus sp. AGMB00486]|uniref:ABC transporter substrate-binding protein n=3 Tax=Anaerococcus TaxID=165779 RepID=A0ABX2NA29_9FIRM|nr:MULTISPECIES: ABC transporter substrate-binding protein [Anaerococcus]MSS77648.1 ABC transporter substrate-binding protein [Anaerococcus porci]NVF11503.1 ABC transporter substrate-binding protein [Anaerococcus faecalis]
MKIKKILKTSLALALSLGVLVGCGGNEKANTASNDASNASTEKKESTIVEDLKDKKVEITFWHAMSGGQGEALEKLVKEFEEKNPNIKVNLQNQAAYKDLNQKLTATMQSVDQLPTITQAYPDWMVQFIDGGLVQDLKPYIENEKLKFDNYDDIVEGLRNEVEKDGKIMALPFNKSTEIFWYNKSLFDELGLKVPRNYDELKEVAKKIHDEKGIAGVGFDSLSNYYQTYLENKGIKMDSKLDVTSDVSKEAINYYLDGIKEGYFRIAGSDKYMSAPFANEQVGAYIGSNAGEVYVKDGVQGKFEYEAAAYPAEKSVQQGTNIYMFNNATEEEKTAAYLFLKFLTEKDSQIQFGLDTGYIPVRQSAIKDDAYKNSDSKVAPIIGEATKELYTRVVEPGSQQAYNDTQSFLEKIFSNPENVDLDKELESFKQTYESAYQQQ